MLWRFFITLIAGSLLSPLYASQNPRLVELSVGDSVVLRLQNGQSRKLRLVSLTEKRDPYFESAHGDFTNAVVLGEVKVEVDGVKETVRGGPFRLPTAVNGLAILLADTRDWSGGIDPDPLRKDVRLETKDASLPWVEPGSLAFPIRDYRWQASNYLHTFLGLAVNQARLYYHRGEDMGMIPDLEAAASMTDGTVVRVPGPDGDGRSNSVRIKNADGVTFRYAHMNAPHILPKLGPGVRVERGEKLGLTGNTWQGKPVYDPHLHVDVTQDDVFRNSFPLLAAAYLNNYPGSVLPIAGGWRHLWVGESIVLDGSLSIASPGRRIRSYEWTFSDGSRAQGPRVRRRYSHTGTYSEQLRVRDDHGTSDIGFVEVFVLDRSVKSPPPYAWINYYPIRGIKPHSKLRFLIRYSHMRDVSIDFGDGTRIPYAEETTHAYTRPGIYVTWVEGKDSGTGLGVFNVRVVVE